MFLRTLGYAAVRLQLEDERVVFLQYVLLASLLFEHPQIQTNTDSRQEEQPREAVQDGLSKMTDEDLDRPINLDNPRQTVGRQIQSIIVGHGFFHLGEVRFLKGLQGMPFPR